jgi:hypothetical protein
MDEAQVIALVADWLRSHGLDYPTEGLAADRFEAGWSVYAPVDIYESDPMAFLDMPVGRSVFLVGDSGHIEETSSSVPPKQAEAQFIAKERAFGSTEAQFMSEFEREFDQAASQGPPAISGFTVVNDDDATAAEASRLLDPVAQQLAMLGPPSWERFSAEFAFTVSAEVARLRFWVGDRSGLVPVPEPIAEMVRAATPRRRADVRRTLVAAAAVRHRPRAAVRGVRLRRRALSGRPDIQERRRRRHRHEPTRPGRTAVHLRKGFDDAAASSPVSTYLTALEQPRAHFSSRRVRHARRRPSRVSKEGDRIQDQWRFFDKTACWPPIPGGPGIPGRVGDGRGEAARRGGEAARGRARSVGRGLSGGDGRGGRDAVRYGSRRSGLVAASVAGPVPWPGGRSPYTKAHTLQLGTNGHESHPRSGGDRP